MYVVLCFQNHYYGDEINVRLTQIDGAKSNSRMVLALKYKNQSVYVIALQKWCYAPGVQEQKHVYLTF